MFIAAEAIVNRVWVSDVSVVGTGRDIDNETSNKMTAGIVLDLKMHWLLSLLSQLLINIKISCEINEFQ